MLKIIVTAILLCGAGACLESIREQRTFGITRYRIRSARLKRKKKFMVLADLHNKSYGTDNKRLLTAIRKEQPDGILIAGDLIVAKPGRDTVVAERLIRELSASYPVYYGNGNHEYRLKLYPETYGTMYEDYCKVLKECDVVHLENKSHDLPEDGIVIHGLDLERQYYRRLQKREMETDYLESVLGRPDGQAFHILLAHNPEYFREYRDWGADLSLAGHLHGGVVRLPGIGGIVSPQIRFFPRHSGGMYEEGGQRMVLSRGLGTHTINFRLFNVPELIVLDLEPE